MPTSGAVFAPTTVASPHPPAGARSPWKPDHRRGVAGQIAAFETHIASIRGLADNHEAEYFHKFSMAPLGDTESAEAQIMKFGSAVATRRVAELCCPEFKVAELRELQEAGLAPEGKHRIPGSKSKTAKELVPIQGILKRWPARRKAATKCFVACLSFRRATGNSIRYGTMTV